MNTKRKTLLAIMICSFLLLSGFVGFWLVQRYHQENKALGTQLEDAMGDTQRQVVDSLLFKTIIKPMFGDSGLAKFQSANKIGEASDIPASEMEDMQFISKDGIEHLPTVKGMNNLKVSLKVNSDQINGKKAKLHKTITMVSSTSHSDSQIGQSENVELRKPKNSINFSSDTSNIVLLQGMRMILGEIATTTDANMKVTSDFSIETDTVLLHKTFKDRMLKKQIDLPVSWANAKGKNFKVNNPDQIHLKTTLFKKNYSVTVQGIQWFLIRKLMTQIAFVILMLGVTALAFILAYRSLLRQERLNTMKNDLINNMSHELKTPVATVKVALEALGDSRVMQNEAVANEYLGMATMELDRLELLLGKVLNSSMLDSKHAMIRKESVDMNSLLEDAVLALKMRANKLGAKVEVLLPESPVILKADRVHVQGVILNLLDNALKYGGDKPQIKLEMHRNANQCVISVTDSGPGIPQEYVSKVFDKFFRVPSGNVHNTKGYGLGLSYARQVMNHHGGSIEVINLPEGGCRFELHFSL